MVNQGQLHSKFSILLHCLFLLAPASLYAQISTATMTGVVVDASSASIPDTSLKLINTQTGAENDSATAHDGRFVLPGIIPGAYTLQIEREGFATVQLRGIVLNVGDTKSLLIRMKVGPVSESVTVDASGLTLNTNDASVSTVIDREFVSNIPLSGRSFLDLISMTPGITTASPQSGGTDAGSQGGFSVNGQQPDSNAFYVDGISANLTSGLTRNSSRISTSGSSGGTTALGTTQSLVSIDALQEFRVLSSTYSAEYGRTPGGQFTFLTRSGTNNLHGSAYAYFRDYVAEGNDWFQSGLYPGRSIVPPTLTQYDFGGTLSGPFKLPGTCYGHDRTFFFASYEGLRLEQPLPARFYYVPSYSFARETPPAIQSILDYVGAGGGQGTGVLVPYSLSPYTLPARLDSTSVRIDHALTSKTSLFLRAGYTPSSSQISDVSSFTNASARTRTLTLGATTQISAQKDNDLRLGIAHNGAAMNTLSGDSASYGGGNREPLSIVLGVPASMGDVSSEAYIHIAGTGDAESHGDISNSSLTQWNLRDTFNLQFANHSFKFGIDQQHIDSTFIPAPIFVGADYFDGQSLLNNQATALVLRQNLPARPTINLFSAFAQDEWHVAESLTLSLGLRWEVSPPPTGAHGADAYTAIGDIASPLSLTLAPHGAPLWHTEWFNLAPRFGAAWKISDEPGRELVIRAGAGVFYNTANQPALRAFQGLGFTSTSVYNNASVPVTMEKLNAVSSTVDAPYTNSNVYLFPTHLQLPYSLQWNVGLEKALGHSQFFTVSYVGALGDRLLQEQRRDINGLNPNFGKVYFFPKGVTSNYQSAQLRYQRTLSHGVQALAAYTFAHSIDYGSPDPAYPLVRGSSDLDVRHNVEAALTWQVPYHSDNRLLRWTFKGWSFDGRVIGRSGFPVPLLGDLFIEPFTGDRYYNGVDLIPGRPLYLRGAQYPGGRIFNGGPDATNPAFVLPSDGDAGDAPRNIVRGFDAIQVNVAAQRDVRLYERFDIQLRAESFNVFNHPDFGYIDPSISDAHFGQATKLLNESFGSAGALYQQGGPRSVQLSFKAIF